MKQNTVNKDLKKERENCPFDIDELTNFWDGGINKTIYRKKMGMYEYQIRPGLTCLPIIISSIFLESFFLSDPNLIDNIPIEYLSHKERYECGIRKSCIVFRKFKEWQEKDDSNGNIMEKCMYILPN